MIPHSCCNGTALALSWYCCGGFLLVLHCDLTGTMVALQWYFPRTGRVLYSHCAGTTLVLHW